MTDPRLERILYSESAIAARVKELGQELTAAYQGRDLMLVGILKGALPFLADLIRVIDLPLAYDLMAVSSYGQASRSSGTVRIQKDLDLAIEGRAVLVVDDIVDTGLTLHYLMEGLQSRQPESLRVCTLLDKPSRRRVELVPDFCGFVVPDVFIVGYGLDYAEQYRNLPYLAVLKED